MGKIIRNGIPYSGSSNSARSINYDNSNSGLEAQTAQAAVDELNKKIEDIDVSGASNIEYLTQVEYDALPASKETNGVEYRITDANTNATVARNIAYDNSESGIEATSVQGAIDALLGNKKETTLLGTFSGSGNNHKLNDSLNNYDAIMYIWIVGNGGVDGGLFPSYEVSIKDFKTNYTSVGTRLSVSAGTAYNGIYYVDDTTIGWTSSNTVNVYGIKHQPILNNSLEELKSTYSTEEVCVGTWINGKKLYRKVVEMTPTSVDAEISHGISNIDDITSFTGIAHIGSKPSTAFIPVGFTSGTGYSIGASITVDKIIFRINNIYINNTYKFIIEYTKTTD